jgi:hypothetical protein
MIRAKKEDKARSGVDYQKDQRAKQVPQAEAIDCHLFKKLTVMYNDTRSKKKPLTVMFKKFFVKYWVT